jgi:cleavage and polyadenylation specificity factor subunit 4
MLQYDDQRDLKFSFEPDFPAADAAVSKRLEVCQAFQTGSCKNGANCAERHVISNLKSVQFEVCKHWLRGACANGNDCLYLHEYEERFIPECAFYAKLGECTNPECTFRHRHPDEKRPKCGAYQRGFCPLGPNCRLRHVPVEPCPDYLAGFCPNGPKCPMGHPVQQLYDKASQFELLTQQMIQEFRDDGNFNPRVTCYKCQDPGHVPKSCPGVPYGRMFQLLQAVHEPGEEPPFTPDGRTRGCFICGEESHTIKDCPEKARRDQMRRRERDSRMMGGGGGYQSYPGNAPAQQMYAPSY